MTRIMNKRGRERPPNTWIDCVVCVIDAVTTDRSEWKKKTYNIDPNLN